MTKQSTDAKPETTTKPEGDKPKRTRKVAPSQYWIMQEREPIGNGSDLVKLLSLNPEESVFVRLTTPDFADRAAAIRWLRDEHKKPGQYWIAAVKPTPVTLAVKQVETVTIA